MRTVQFCMKSGCRARATYTARIRWFDDEELVAVIELCDDHAAELETAQEHGDSGLSLIALVAYGHSTMQG